MSAPFNFYPSLGSVYTQNYALSNWINNFDRNHQRPKKPILPGYQNFGTQTFLNKDEINSTSEKLILYSNDIIMNNYPETTMKTYYLNNYYQKTEVNSNYDYKSQILTIDLDASFYDLSRINLITVFEYIFVSIPVTVVFSGNYSNNYANL